MSQTWPEGWNQPMGDLNQLLKRKKINIGGKYLNEYLKSDCRHSPILFLTIDNVLH